MGNPLDREQEHAEVPQGFDVMGLLPAYILVRISGTFPLTILHVREMPETFHEYRLILFELVGKMYGFLGVVVR